MAVEIDKVKSYLRVDFEEDDLYIQDLIVVSEIYIEFCVGTAYLKDEKGLKIAELLQLKLIKDMYDVRGTEIPSNSKKDTIVTTMLDVLSNIEEVV